MTKFEEKKENRSSWRAIQTWLILIGYAQDQRILTYGQLAKMLGYKDARPLTHILGKIMYFCQDVALPPLTVLVVGKGRGAPGVGLSIGNYKTLDLARMAVFKTDWYSMIPPTVDEFEAASKG